MEGGAPSAGAFGSAAKISCRRLNVRYGGFSALNNIDLEISDPGVTALIGPSGAGKSTLLRCLNRMNDSISGCEVSGCVEVNGCDIYAPAHDPVLARAMTGMICDRPNPYPKSIYENVAYGLRIHGKVATRSEEYTVVEKALRGVGLWMDVCRRLHRPASELSLGQQQKLCLARVLAIDPDIVLMDEPCAALDPVSTAEIEALIESLTSRYTIILVTQSLQQAARVSKTTAFLQQGRLIEAEDYFNRALLKNPDAAITWLARGITRSQQAKAESAQQDIAYAATLFDQQGDIATALELRNQLKKLEQKEQQKAGNGYGSGLLRTAGELFQQLAPLAMKFFVPTPF